MQKIQSVFKMTSQITAAIFVLILFIAASWIASVLIKKPKVGDIFNCQSCGRSDAHISSTIDLSAQSFNQGFYSCGCGCGPFSQTGFWKSP